MRSESLQFEGQGMEEELLQLMKAADVDGDGTIDYAEFLAATVQLSTLQSEDNLEKVCCIARLGIVPMWSICIPYHSPGHGARVCFMEERCL